MGQGRLMHGLVRGILLLAAAIQGITADAEDICSLNALRLLRLVPADSDPGDTRDQWPDDVCEAAVTEAKDALPGNPESDPAAVPECAGHAGLIGALESPAIRPEVHLSPVLVAGALARSLCRLRC